MGNCLSAPPVDPGTRLKELQQKGCRIVAGSACHIGAGKPPRRPENQDWVQIFENYGPNGDIFFGICLDGHGSHGLAISQAVGNWFAEHASDLIKKAIDECPEELRKKEAEQIAKQKEKALKKKKKAARNNKPPPPDDDEYEDPLPGMPDEQWTFFLNDLFAKCAAFLQENSELKRKIRGSGTTATLVFIHKGRLHIGYVGDSEAVLINRPTGEEKFSFESLTPVHRPSEEAEREEVQRRGGLVLKLKPVYVEEPAPEGEGDGEDPNNKGRRLSIIKIEDDEDEEESKKPYRVWLRPEKAQELGYKRAVPGLELSRSLGDDLAHEAGVTSIPKIVHRVLDRNHDKFLVVGSDGVWDACKKDQVAAFCYNARWELNLTKTTETLLQWTLHEWEEKKKADNISFFILKLHYKPRPVS